MTVGVSSAAGAELKALFLGDEGPHRPRQRFAQLQSVLHERGITLTYTDDVTDLNAARLAEFDVLVLYANIDRIEPEQEQALLDYVAGGGGFVPLHCASFCFRNSERVVALIGAQFQRHGWARVRDTLAETDHPINKDYGGFESWDETYVHHRHNEQDRLVLSYRVDGDGREPWTWVRRHGKGRVFYTAWGHDHHTWRHPGFHKLVERGIRWAAGQDPAEAKPFLSETPFITPKMTSLPSGPEPFEYVDVGAKIPNYVPSDRWGEQGDPYRLMQKPLPPEESMKRMVVPEGFRVDLYAAEPDLGGKPICMTWDERGRLWLAETVDYPNELQPQNRGRDRIRICEDTDGDNRADKFTVFAEHLSIPTSIAFAHGGVIVHNGTESLFLKDTDGDDVADERRVLFGTWAMRDTHGGPSNMQYGLDNWIWGMQGYNNSTIRIGDRAVRFAQGFHRFRPDGTAIEFIRSTNNNTWGFGMSEEGIIFGSTANGHPSIYMPIANRYYERVRGWTPRLTLTTIADSSRFQSITDKVRQVDHHGRYTAGAGHALYTARAYPRQWWNRTAFVCEPTGHIVGTFVLARDGADFHATSPCNLLASDDAWTAPIMAEVGPDGYVWIIDWYNYIVQHNPTPQGFETGKGSAYETDLRDKRHGRIYRVVYEAAAPSKRLDLTRATPAELVATLANDNLFWRRHAQRLLVERGQLDVVPQLVELVGDTSVDEIGLNVGAIHALWTLHGRGALDGSHSEATAAAIAALRHPSAGVRRNALQVLSPGDESTVEILDARLLDDPDAQVRLAALLALADQPPNAQCGRAIAQFLTRAENHGDRWLVDAAASAAAAHAIDFLLASAEVDTPSDRQRQVSQIVANHFARSNPDGSLERLLSSLVDADPRLAGAVIAGLQTGWPADRAIPLDGIAEDTIDRLRERLNVEEQSHLVRLLIRGGNTEMHADLSELIESLFEQAENEGLDIPDRISAAELIVAVQPDDIQTAERLLALATAQAAPDFNGGLIRALRQCTAPSLGTVLIDQLSTFTPSTREAVFELLLGRPSLAAALLDALEKGTIQVGELSLAQKQRLSEYPDRRLREQARLILANVQQTVSPDRQQVLAQYTDVARTKGSSVNGKALFTKHCGTCHRYQGEGAAVGPDLTGMAAVGKEQLLVHVLDPSRDVEGNYQSYLIMLQDGRVLNGMLAGESATSIELIDAEARLHPILREDIDELSRSNKSIMPDGFEQQLSRTDLADLLEFLAQPSRFIPLDIHRVATVSSAHGMFQTPRSEVERIVFDDWGMKSVDGVPFYPADPKGGQVRNVVMLHSDLGTIPPKMPKAVQLRCRTAAKAIHFLSGVGGWSYPATPAGTVSMTVRLHYADGSQEDHPLINGTHFADYLGHTEVPGSQLAFSLGRQQLRYFKIEPKKNEVINQVELIKGRDRTAPVVVAVTVEQP